MFKHVQFLFAGLLCLMLSACGGPGGQVSSGPNMTSLAVVSNDPNAMPNIGWQNQSDRKELNQATAVPARKVKVAMLLPLTGKHADLGQSMWKAAQMALFDVGSANFEMVPKDTQSTSAGASQAAQEAANAGAQMFLGPIFAEDVRAVKPVSSARNIPMVAFTTDWTLGGGDTYILGFLPFAQVARVAQYAQTHGADRIAVYAPTTPYCDAVIGTLGRTGISPVAVGRYSPQQADLSAQVAAFAASSKDKFNALLLPVGGEGLRSLTSVLSSNGINSRNTRFLGTGLWDESSLTGDPSLYGGWFAAPDPASRRDFERRYNENYGGSPLRLSSLAYDATALAAVLARSGGDAPYSRERLHNPRGFAGIDGIFRFRNDGLSERGLAVLEIQSGRARVIDPAPTAFLAGS
ncbi:MAG TPA: penicillin-binding protein activator [Patescibacteria group bacterium]|nr:penicillin-binding protein activator [Patescibacteria group bacterium]